MAGKENFLDRWSRLKREAEDLPREKEEEEHSEAPALPPVDKLTPESDFTGFMHPRVEDALRRVALKKLFSDPHFGVPDPFEPFSGDWTVGEPISEEMLATLNQARTLLFDERKKEEPNTEEAPKIAGGDTLVEQPPESEQDEPGRKDA